MGVGAVRGFERIGKIVQGVVVAGEQDAAVAVLGEGMGERAPCRKRHR